MSNCEKRTETKEPLAEATLPCVGWAVYFWHALAPGNRHFLDGGGCWCTFGNLYTSKKKAVAKMRTMLKWGADAVRIAPVHGFLPDSEPEVR